MPHSKHTVTAFDADLDSLKDNLMQMGELVETAFADATKALLSADQAAARKAIANDEAVDALERRVEDAAVQTIVRRQPMAVDLRDIMAATRIASELERIGDLAKNIAKRTLVLGSEEIPQDLGERIAQMSALARRQLRQVLDAYAERDAVKAITIREGDSEIDVLNTEVFKESIEYISRTYKDVAGITHLLFCAKNIERVGDHVTNISENVYFIATGSMPEVERTKRDASSSIHPAGGENTTS